MPEPIRALVASLAATMALAGCTDTADDPEVRPHELSEAGHRPCPAELPVGDDPSGHGFGTDEPADQRPNLLEPKRAWACRYDPVDVARTDNGGTTYGWKRNGPPVLLADSDLPDLRSALDELEPADRNSDCTADLGPRWMIVLDHDGDLTGVVVDDYGCRDVRLTDDPHHTAPGADDQDRTVGGVLDGGQAILDAVGVGRN